MSCEHRCNRLDPIACAGTCAAITEHSWHRCEDHAGDADSDPFSVENEGLFGRYRLGVIERLNEARNYEALVTSIERASFVETARSLSTMVCDDQFTSDGVPCANPLPCVDHPRGCHSPGCTRQAPHTGPHNPPSAAQLRRLERGFEYGGANLWPSAWNRVDRLHWQALIVSGSYQRLAEERRRAARDRFSMTPIDIHGTVQATMQALTEMPPLGPPEPGELVMTAVDLFLNNLSATGAFGSGANAAPTVAPLRTFFCSTCFHPKELDATCDRHCSAASVDWHGCILPQSHEGLHQSDNARQGGFWEFERNGGPARRRFGIRVNEHPLERRRTDRDFFNRRSRRNEDGSLVVSLSAVDCYALGIPIWRSGPDGIDGLGSTAGLQPYENRIRIALAPPLIGPVNRWRVGPQLGLELEFSPPRGRTVAPGTEDLVNPAVGQQADAGVAPLSPPPWTGWSADPICRCGHFRSEHDGRSEPDLCDAFEPEAEATQPPVVLMDLSAIGLGTDVPVTRVTGLVGGAPGVRIRQTTYGPVAEVTVQSHLLAHERQPRVTIALSGGGFLFLCEGCSARATRGPMMTSEICERCRSRLPERVRRELEVRAELAANQVAIFHDLERAISVQVPAEPPAGRETEPQPAPSLLRRLLRAEPLFDRLVGWWRARQERIMPSTAEINRALIGGNLSVGTSGLPVDEDARSTQRR